MKAGPSLGRIGILVDPTHFNPRSLRCSVKVSVILRPVWCPRSQLMDWYCLVNAVLGPVKTNRHHPGFGFMRSVETPKDSDRFHQVLPCSICGSRYRVIFTIVLGPIKPVMRVFLTA